MKSQKKACGATGFLVVMTPVTIGLWKWLTAEIEAPDFILVEPDKDALVLFYLFLSIFFVLAGYFAGFVFEEFQARSEKLEKSESGPSSKSSRRKKKKKKHRAELASKMGLLDEVLGERTLSEENNVQTGQLSSLTVEETDEEEEFEEEESEEPEAESEEKKE